MPHDEERVEISKHEYARLVDLRGSFRERAEATAEQWCAMNLPLGWFNDEHGPGTDPRCCRTIEGLATIIEAALREGVG